MDEQTVREYADAYCEALTTGDMERAAQNLSEQLQANLGQLVAMLPMPLEMATVESLERTASGFLAILHLASEGTETRLETRWKDRDGRPVIVEVSHLTEEATASADTPETTTPEE